MKLNWTTKNQVVWTADFWNGCLELRINLHTETMGIYDSDFIVWETPIASLNCSTGPASRNWSTVAEAVERVLRERLSYVAQTLDTSLLEAPAELCCDTCGQENVELYPGFIDGDDSRCPACYWSLVETVAKKHELAAAPKAEKHPLEPIYWVEKLYNPDYTIKFAPSPTQVEDSIKAEAKDVKL